MGGGAVSARSVKVVTSVSTANIAVTARSAEAAASVNTDGCAVAARSAEGQTSVNTEGRKAHARIAEGQATQYCQHGRRRTHCTDCASVYIGHEVTGGGKVESFATKGFKFTVRDTDGTTSQFSMPALKKMLL